MALRILMFLLCFAPSADGLFAQKNLRIAVPVRVEAGWNFAQMAPGSSNWFQRPGTAVTLGSGIGLRFKERLTLSIEGGALLDTYGFNNQIDEYVVTNFLFETRVNLGYMFPFKKDPSFALGIGFDYGHTFYVPDVSERTVAGTSITARAFGGTTPLYSPEIGVYRRGKHLQMSFMLTYVYHDRSTPSIAIQFNAPNGDVEALAESKGDYLGFRYRAMFDIWGHKPLVQKVVPEPPVEVVSAFNERPVRVRETLTSKRQRMVLRFWDNADVDGDSISVSVNGRFVLSNHALDKAKKRVVVILEPGENVITVYAHNEGRVPPNTSACSIRTGFFRKSLVFSTGMNRNEALIVNY
jgi:hypothetical protein